MIDEQRKFGWTEIYDYYKTGGLGMFIMERVSSLFIGIVISFAPILLFGCIHFAKMGSGSSISEITISFSDGWKSCGFFVKSCSLIFCGFNILQVFQLLVSLPRYLALKKYYNKVLQINDNDLSVTEWPEIVDAVVVNDSARRVSVLEIAQQVMRFDNYLISIISDAYLLNWKLPWNSLPTPLPLDQFMVYLLKLSLTGTVFDKNGCSMVNQGGSIRAPIIIRQLEKRFKLIGLILFLLSPFIFAFEILYLFFYYAQEVRDSPNSLSLRRWTERSKWIIREYNELPHIFNQRISKSYEFANIYVDLFPSVYLHPICRSISFLCGAAMAILLVIGLFTDINLLLNIKIIGGKTVAWLMAVLASIYAVTRSMMNHETNGITPDEAMAEVNKVIHYDFTDESNSAHSWQAEKRFSSFFQPLWMQLVQEVSSVIVNPFIFLVVLPTKAKSIVEFVQRNSREHPYLGWICAFSMFQSSDDLNTFSGTPDQMDKMTRSMQSFDSENQQQIQQAPIDLQNNSFVVDDLLLPDRVASPIQSPMFDSIVGSMHDENVQMTPDQFLADDL